MWVYIKDLHKNMAKQQFDATHSEKLQLYVTYEDITLSNIT